MKEVHSLIVKQKIFKVKLYSEVTVNIVPSYSIEISYQLTTVTARVYYYISVLSV